jgi:gluconate 2-dehydrogenase gamma chain
MSDDRQPPTTWHELKPPESRPNRRFMLKAAMGSGAVLLAGGPSATQAAKALLDEYKPVYLNANEWPSCARRARLIPSAGDGPGAIEAQVPVFIDRQLAGDFGSAADWFMGGPHEADANPQRGFQSPLTPAQIYRGAIAAVDGWCTQNKGKAFAALDEAAQDEVLKTLQAGKLGLKAELRDFFAFLLQNTKEGFLADPMYGGNHQMVGWKHIGFPGARGVPGMGQRPGQAVPAGAGGHFRGKG